MKSVLIIGAGIGGIATAARLARQGCQVTVVEKNDRPGGRCGDLVQDGHQFVCGPTLFLMPELYAQTFSDLGERMADHLELLRVDPTYHVHFHDGTTLALSSDLLAMKRQLEAIEKGSFSRYLAYLHQGHRHYELSLKHLMQRNFRNLAAFCTPRNLLLFLQIKALTRHEQDISRFFRDERLRAAFTFQDMYVGLSPSQAPALFSLLQYSELANGVWFPKGGMYQVITVLVRIAQKWGVQFLYDTPVTQIATARNRATGVYLADGRELSAEIIVANADLPYVYAQLLPDDGMARRLAGKQYSCSALIYCWGVDKRYSQLQPHHLFFAADIQHNYKLVTEDHAISADPSFYLHAPVGLDPALAPAGADTLTAVVPVGHLEDECQQDWTAIREQTREAVFQRLSAFGLSDLQQHIKFEIAYTPLDWQARFNLAKGASHGLSHNLLQMGYFRPHNRHARYHNLFFTGASTHPGTGLPTVLVSSRLVSERIQQEILADINLSRPASPAAVIH